MARLVLGLALGAGLVVAVWCGYTLGAAFQNLANALGGAQ